MLLEALVISLCMQNKGGCSESSEAYYKGCPECQAVAKRGERFAKQNIPDPIMNYVLPVAGAAFGKKGTIKLSNHWAVEVDKSSGGSLVFRWTY